MTLQPKPAIPIRQFLLEQVTEHPHDLVSFAAQTFGITPPAVHRHLSRLIEEGKIIKTGRTRGAVYHLSTAKNKSLTFPISPELEEHQIWKDYFEEAFKGLKKNVFNICIYGFGEMVNNAIDHSNGRHVSICTQWSPHEVTLTIGDDGVGIFRKIKNSLQLDDEKESMLQLSKGKFTTDPKNHSGEGIFFTSRMFDQFLISSYGVSYFRINPENDWFFESAPKRVEGTFVSMTISLNADTEPGEVYRQFTLFDEEEGVPGFNKTHIVVELSKKGDERYVSRSQAKRVLIGLDRFKHIVFDFKNIEMVGQGFVDEVFRIYADRHPTISMEYTNANDDVKFMIERSIPR